MNRIKEFKRVYKHKIAIYKLWKTKNTKVSLLRIIKHDLEKIILILLFGDKIATKIHRKVARHHNIKTDSDLFEAYLDWASARYTKPEMQMDALETCEKFHPFLYDKCIKHYNNVKYK